MKNLSARIIEKTLRHRLLVFLLVGSMTAFFAFQLKNFSLSFDLFELLPTGHPNVALYQAHPQFGQANVVYVMLEAQKGDIYNPLFLEKLQTLTQKIDRLEGVNHYQVWSLTQKKVKEIKSSDWGLEIEPVVGAEIPRDSAGLAQLKEKVESNPFVYGSLVSVDQRKALISAGFFDQGVDYKKLYGEVEKLCQEEETADIRIYRAGEPLLLGKIHSLFSQTLWIACFSLGLVFVVLIWYLKDFRLALVPVISMTASAIWGLGFLSMLGKSLNPLMMVIPLVISARVLSHSVQMACRFQDASATGKDSFLAAKEAGVALFAPGFAALVADALGIAVVILTPLPVLQKLGLLGAFWIFSILFTVQILNPVLLSFWRPGKFSSFGNARVSSLPLSQFLERFLYSRGVKLISVIALVLTLAVVWLSRQVPVGEEVASTPLLWQNSFYNESLEKINQNFPGTEQLTLVVEGKSPGALQDPEVLKTMEEFQHRMQSTTPAGGSVSLANLVKSMNRHLHYDSPRWERLPSTKEETAILVYLFGSSSDPGDLDRFTDYDFKNGSVSVFYKDHRPSTLASALTQAKQFVQENQPKGAELKLASGSFGLLSAENEVLNSSLRQVTLLTYLLIFLVCALSFRSLTAAVLLTVGLLLSHGLTMGYMLVKGMGINIHILPVSSLGIGLGVDYGIYLLYKLKEDYAKRRNYPKALADSLTTAGRPIIFTALILSVSVVFWYFLSELRFQAEMGLLLGFLLILNMLSAIVILPGLVWLLRPKFIFALAQKDFALETKIMEGEGTHAQIPELE